MVCRFIESGSTKCFVLLCHFVHQVFLSGDWGAFDVSIGPDDDAAHLCYSYFVISSMMIIKSVAHHCSMPPWSPCLHAEVLQLIL